MIVQRVSSYISLLKLPIVALLLFVSSAALFLAAKGSLPLVPFTSLLISGGLAASGASALNHYLERDLDGLMSRTAQRPLVSGRIGHPTIALALGLSLITLALVIALPLNLGLAFLLLAGIIVYVVVYTAWLKRVSRWNIVVGGLSGSCAVLAGWAAIDSWWTPEPLLLALLLFLWTPPHFWSLAMVHADDYRRAGIPMLPVVVEPRAAANWGLIQVLLTVLVSLVITPAGKFGWLYLSIALTVGLVFVATAVSLVQQPGHAAARMHFRVSNIYLASIFAGMILDAYLRYRIP